MPLHLDPFPDPPRGAPGRQGGGQHAWGSISAGGRPASQSTRRSSCIPAWPSPAHTPLALCALGKALAPTTWVRAGALLPALLPLGATVPCHQQNPGEGLPCVATDHQRGSCPSPPRSAWPFIVPGMARPQTTNATARDHHGTLQGAVMMSASLH